MASIKQGLKAVFDRSFDFFSFFMAPLISYMAKSGAGSSQCLKFGCLPVQVHFYQPIPDLKDLEQRDIWRKISNLPGLKFSPPSYLNFLGVIGGRYGKECTWPPDRTDDSFKFYTNNPSFSYGCAAVLHCMIRYYKPRRIIEIGSGLSSLIINEAISRNIESSPGDLPKYTIIDPYPGSTIGHLPNKSELISDRVEKTDISLFLELEENDILFIDSGHVVRIGGDVNFLILEVLPRLNSGVITHFHDIPLPYEYQEVYAKNPKFRMFWTESYLLQAFLCLNDCYEILLPMNYIMTEFFSTFREIFKNYPPNDKSISGSFWIRRK